MLELKDTPFTRQLCQSVVFEIADSDENNNLTFDEVTDLNGVAVTEWMDGMDGWLREWID